jgi:hypothetical protein
MARIRKILDLVGTRVGRLVVISAAPDRVRVRKDSSNSVRAYWNCLCDCGKSIEVRQDAILSSKSNSCGCIRDEIAKTNIRIAIANYKPRVAEDLTGKKFGRLTAINEAERSVTPKGRSLIRWNCLCTCGTVKDYLSDQLRAGKSTSCGCILPDFVNSLFNSQGEIFKYKASLVHGDKYDYQLVDYKHSQEDIYIVCRDHGTFRQQPSNHLNGSGCPRCSGVRGNDYDLHLTPLVCDKHSEEFYSNSKCKVCVEEKETYDAKSFVEKAIEVHGGRYDYSKTVFTNRLDDVSIICSRHGEFKQKAYSHLDGKNCLKCSIEDRGLGFEGFLEKSIQKHGDRYDYSNVDYSHINTPVEIVCSTHGSFWQKPSVHFNGSNCPKCSIEVRAEKQHWNYLERCRLNPEMGESIGCIYLLKMTHEEESFLKLGISSNHKKRLARYREENIDFEVITLKEMKNIAAAILERDILAAIKQAGFKYLPQVEFKGYTECSTLEAENFILERIYDG